MGIPKVERRQVWHKQRTQDEAGEFSRGQTMQWPFRLYQ